MTRLSKRESDSEEDEEVMMKRRDTPKNLVGRERISENYDDQLVEG